MGRDELLTRLREAVAAAEQDSERFESALRRTNAARRDAIFVLRQFEAATLADDDASIISVVSSVSTSTTRTDTSRDSFVYAGSSETSNAPVYASFFETASPTSPSLPSDSDGTWFPQTKCIAAQDIFVDADRCEAGLETLSEHHLVSNPFTKIQTGGREQLLRAQRVQSMLQTQSAHAQILRLQLEANERQVEVARLLSVMREKSSREMRAAQILKGSPGVESEDVPMGVFRQASFPCADTSPMKSQQRQSHSDLNGIRKDLLTMLGIDAPPHPEGHCKKVSCLKDERLYPDTSILGDAPSSLAPVRLVGPFPPRKMCKEKQQMCLESAAAPQKRYLETSNHEPGQLFAPDTHSCPLREVEFSCHAKEFKPSY